MANRRISGIEKLDENLGTSSNSLPTDRVSVPTPQERECASAHHPPTRTPTDAPSPPILDEQRASYLRSGGIPMVAIYTLTALVAQDLAYQASANPATITELPNTNEADNLVIAEPTEELAINQATLKRASNAVASPESLNVREFVPESFPARELPAAQTEQELERDIAPIVTHPQPVPIATSIAAPEAEVILERTSVLKERSLPSQPMESSNQLAIADIAPTPEESLESQQTEEVVAQAVPKKSCLAYTPAAGETVNLQPTPNAVGQSPRTRSCLEVEQLQEELRELEEVEFEEDLRASPALSIVIPTAFGADRNTGFISATYQERTRFSDVDDGGLGIGIGLGDARNAVGVELSYAIASFGSNRDFGTGGFNVKVHRQLGNGWAVAGGWNGFLNIGDENDFEDSVYGVVSKIIRTREDINSPFSRVAITAGVGSGQFRTEDAVTDDEDNINVFGNVAVRVVQPVSLIAEWSGQDLGVGLSIAPFKNIPLVITPAVRDIVGAGDGARFVLGAGFAFKF